MLPRNGFSPVASSLVDGVQTSLLTSVPAESVPPSSVSSLSVSLALSADSPDKSVVPESATFEPVVPESAVLALSVFESEVPCVSEPAVADSLDEPDESTVVDSLDEPDEPAVADSLDEPEQATSRLVSARLDKQTSVFVR